MTAHFMDSKFELCSYLLECSEISISHTGSNIADWITNITDSFKITNKLFALVTDNATNMKSASAILNLPHLPCGAHTLNLVVQQALRNIKSTKENVKSIVMHFEISSKAAQKLSEMQTNLNHPQLKIKQDCPNRWNSTYEMLDRFKQNIIPLASCIATLKISSKLEEEDWVIIEQATKILKSLLQKIIDKKEREILHPKVIEIVDELIVGLQNRFEKTNNLELVSYAILIDPRFKKNGFLGCDAQYQDVYDKIIEKMIPFQSEIEKENQMTNSPSQFTHNASSSRILSALELNRYILEQNLRVKSDPFIWWKEREAVYPTLSMFAKQYLSIPASSVPCE
uniref:HAT C-terminal dimerisation domain-containing protein n=1 Tax=Anopheles minimus TaxID=112268 RepID=A0A182W7V9_9DIPT